MKNTNWKLIVGLLIATWALIHLQRSTLGFLAPYVVGEFSLSYTQFGMAMAIFGMTYSLGALASGFMSDRIGNRPIIFVTTLVSGLFGWITGMVSAFWQLLSVRTLMGFTEGSAYPPVSASVIQVTPKNQRDMITSLYHGCGIGLGIGLGGVIVSMLAAEFGWRPAFFVAAVPLVILSFVLHGILRGNKSLDAAQAEVKPAFSEAFKSVVSNRNVLICMLIAFCIIGRAFVTVTFAGLYLGEVHGMSAEMGGVFVALAMVGEIAGALILSGVLGQKLQNHKLIVGTCMALGGVFLLTFALAPVGTPVPVLFATAFIYSALIGGVVPLVMFTIPTESCGPGKAASAIGMAVFLAEFLGGGVLPLVAGGIADAVGLAMMFAALGVLMFLAALAAVGLINTRSKKTSTDSASI